MKIGMLGTGGVGQALGTGFASLGHEVRMGSRDPASEKVSSWVERIGHLASSGTFQEAASFGKLVVLCTRGEGTENAIELADPKNFANKTVIDATNPVDHFVSLTTMFVGFDDSLGERVQGWLPDSHVVKAFNIVGRKHMVNPNFPGGPPDMFICGNDSAAKQEVTKQLTELGWSTIDIGGIEGARLLEPLGMLWLTYGLGAGAFDHTFRLLRK